MAGRPLLLDTTVYVDVLQGTPQVEVQEILRRRVVNHSTVALAELTHLVGALDPGHPGTRRTLTILGETIDDIPPRRLTAPSTRAFGEAGMLAGLAARLSGRGKTVALLADALLLLQAAETGCDLLTGNVADFDLLDQLLPGTGVVFYR